MRQSLKFYKSPLGNKEFKSAKTQLDIVKEKEWVIIHGICHLLGSFHYETEWRKLLCCTKVLVVRRKEVFSLHCRSITLHRTHFLNEIS